MLASNQFVANSPILAAPVTASVTANVSAARPAWVNRLLGVRPAPILEEQAHEAPRVYPTVEGVTTASAFRCHPR